MSLSTPQKLQTQQHQHRDENENNETLLIETELQLRDCWVARKGKFFMNDNNFFCYSLFKLLNAAWIVFNTFK
jgi:hypothetical protein